MGKPSTKIKDKKKPESNPSLKIAILAVIVPAITAIVVTSVQYILAPSIERNTAETAEARVLTLTSLALSPSPSDTLPPSATWTSEPTLTVTIQPSSTKLSPSPSPVPTTPSPQCPNVEIADDLKFNFVTGLKEKSPENGEIILASDEIEGLVNLQGQAIITNLGSCTCKWEGRTTSTDPWKIITSTAVGDCGFSIEISSETSALFLRLTVGEKIKPFTIKMT